MSDNRDYRDYHLYETDCDNPWSFDETCFAKHFAKQEGRFAVFQRGQTAVEGTEGRRGDRGHRMNRGQYRGQRALEETEDPREDRWS